MEILLEYLNSIYPLSAELLDALRRYLKYEEVHKNQILVHKGEICKRIYFIESGLLKVFTHGLHSEYCNWFLKDGDVAIAEESFLCQVVSDRSIQAIEATEVHSITFDELNYILEKFPDFYIHKCALLQKYYLQAVKRIDALQRMDADGKYKYILNHFPELPERVMDKDIASYLGVTKEHFCKIKNRIWTI